MKDIVLSHHVDDDEGSLTSISDDTASVKSGSISHSLN